MISFAGEIKQSDVARMQRSAIRESLPQTIPDCAALHPGYEKIKRIVAPLKNGVQKFRSK